jgi:hypothetical protein
MDTRDLYKLVRELSEERDDVVNLYDSVDLELNEGFVIETGVVGFTEDGVIVHLDEDAMEFLGFNGVLLESEEMNEGEGTADAVCNAIYNRIARQHPDVLQKFGPRAVEYAAEDLAQDYDDLHEIGSSDVSIWTKQVIQDLESGQYSHLSEGEYTSIDSFKNKLSRSSDPFEMVYDAISGHYGEEIRTAMQEMYDDVVIDSQGRLHPDDDFEPIINNIIDQLVDDGDYDQIDELAAIKKLAHGEEEVAEGLGKALLGGAALIAAITGVNKMQADHMMKSEPQLIKLAQMRQAAEQKGDQYEVQSLDDRIQKTMDHIRVTGRPVMGPDGKPVVPGEPIGEAEYQGRKVPLGKPMQGDVKKSKVYVRKPNGKVVKVNFGDKNMRIKKSSPGHRKSFRARHHCENPGPRWKARYWSCRAW